MDALDALLKTAAEADWAQVVRRCAWCGRVADRHGRYVHAVIVEPETVFTDGMCPPCGSRALARLARRPGRAALAA